MADDPRDIANNPAAPEGERFDARVELAKPHRPTSAQVENAGTLLQALRDELDHSEVMAKASSHAFAGRATPAPARGMQSVHLDPYQITTASQYIERPGALPFDAMRRMVAETPVLMAVHRTRIRQVNRFCGISEDGGPGFEIRHVDRKHKLLPEEADACRALGRFFANCGWEWNPRRRRALRRDTLPTFMAKSVDDSMTMDSAPIETEWKADRARGLDGFYAFDGATVRLCTEEGYEGDDEVIALQVVQGSIVNAYTAEQLIYEPRNPRTDVRAGGYGMGEPETLVRVVTGFLNAMSLNIAGFDANSIPKGMLNITGDYQADDIVAFKRYWQQTVRGVQNAFGLPVMFTKEGQGKAEFVKFGVEHDEMYFSKWMTFLTSMICAIYGMAPDEINFESFAASRSSLSGSDTAEKLADSKDKGLRPLLSYYENLFSDFIVSEFSDKYCFRWAGLEARDEQREWEAKKLITTVDELRAEQGYERHPEPLIGGAPLNPALIGLYQASKQPPPPEPAPDFGTEGEDGGQGGGGEAAGGEQDGAGEGAAPPEQPAAPGAGAADGDFGGEGQGDFGKALPTIYQIGGR